MNGGRALRAVAGSDATMYLRCRRYPPPPAHSCTDDCCVGIVNVEREGQKNSQYIMLWKDGNESEEM